MDFVEKLFWSIGIFIGVHFLWLAGLERTIPLVVGTIVASALAVGFFMIARVIWPYERED